MVTLNIPPSLTVCPQQLELNHIIASYSHDADRLNIGKETVRRIVTEDLGKRKICARFVPHALTTEQKQERVVYCQDLLLMGQDEHFWENIITGDETWCFAYDPATK